ncbi:hypothetical protein KFE96_17360 [Kordiimonas sp. SCSIO 12603]|uniref:ABC transporter six-transmembrane domain-containing protein n=1 Tax=Kordiimonas sp. SCSIO 12603 TaxID=2829596 RepID=UPI002104D978|nr:ABC transporter six-transmembrane domain-containing protein [Kordiimonas sp. SCSIO 12603]UTW58564.1 hypothetical protein KFE96_17360 [Kordiimonas sp. SCSIO 12603]
MENITHGKILKKFSGKISITFLMLVLENLLRVLEPLALGMAINGLVEKEWLGIYIFLGVEVGMIVVGTLRRFYDTRAYGAIYREISEDISGEAIENHDDLSPAIGRADLLKEVIDFFENELPMGLSSVFAIGGALIMLFIIAPLTGTVAVGAALLIGLVFLLSKKRMISLNKLINNELEARARVFMSRQKEKLEGHFGSLVKHRIALSDLEARNFGLTYMFVVLMIAFSLYDSVLLIGANMGDVFAIITYASQFAEGVIILPYMYQQYIRTQEITGRLKDAPAIEEAEEPAKEVQEL